MLSRISAEITHSLCKKARLFLVGGSWFVVALPPYCIAQNFDNYQDKTISSNVTRLEINASSLATELKQHISMFREENLVIYLVIYISLIGLILSLLISILSYRFSDKMSPYRQVRRQTSLLAAACGAGAGIVVAALEVPHHHPARLSLLMLFVTTGAIVTWSISWLAFAFMRIRTLSQGRLEGRAFSERMRQG